MKITIEIEIQDGVPAPEGTAQRLIEQIALSIGSHAASGTVEHKSEDGKGVLASGSFTTTAD